jgi:hypothetical protein
MTNQADDVGSLISSKAGLEYTGQSVAIPFFRLSMLKKKKKKKKKTFFLLQCCLL